MSPDLLASVNNHMKAKLVCVEKQSTAAAKVNVKTRKWKLQPLIFQSCSSTKMVITNQTSHSGCYSLLPHQPQNTDE